MRVRTKPNRRYSDETRIGACADYLLGRPHAEIERKWNVDMGTVHNWIRRTGSFKTRDGDTRHIRRPRKLLRAS